MIPALTALGLLVYYPAASGIYHSFYRWNAADIAEPVGFANYKDLLFSEEFWRSFRNAFLLGLWNVIKMIPPIFVAVAIHRCRSDRMQFFYRAMFVIPMVIPPLVIALIWRSFFFEATSGYLNLFVDALSLRPFLHFLSPLFGWGDVFIEPGNPAWLGDPRLIFTACVIWGFPFVGSLAVLTHLAKLQGISKDVYEAGNIDGVNWWTKFTRIELPLITGSIYIMLVFAIIGTITDAGIIFALAGMEGGPGGRVDVPALFMIRKAFIDQRMGYACAVGIILMLVTMSLQKTSALFNDWKTYNVEDRRRIRRRLVFAAVLINLIAPATMLWGQTDTAFYHILFTEPAQTVAGWFRAWQAGTPLIGAVRDEPLTLLLTWLGGWQNGYAFRFPQILHVVSIVMAVASVPYPALWKGWIHTDRPAGRGKRATEAESERCIGDERVRRAILREESAGYRALRRTGEIAIRACKHGYIWFVLLFALLPLYLMLIVSLKTNTQFYQAPATVTAPFHWENWGEAWRIITPTLANSVFIAVSSSLVTLFFALCAAYYFARLRVPLSSFFWNAILILMMLPMIANLIPMFRLLSQLNMLNTLTALILVGAAQGQVFAIFMLRNFVQDVPGDLYESAEIDGAGHFRQMWMIVLPLSGPILGTVGVMHFMTAWNEFMLPLIVMRDHARLPVMVQLLRMAGEYIKLWGPLMAGYAMASVPIIVLFIFSMKLFVRGMTEGAIKG